MLIHVFSISSTQACKLLNNATVSLQFQIHFITICDTATLIQCGRMAHHLYIINFVIEEKVQLAQILMRFLLYSAQNNQKRHFLTVNTFYNNETFLLQ